MTSPPSAMAPIPDRAPRVAVVLGLLWATILLIQCGLAPATIDLDMFHEMALAREILSTGHVPLHDTFAYTPTVYPVIQHEWGMGVLLYFVVTRGGLAGLTVLLLLLVGAIVAVCIAVARQRGATWPVIVVAEMIFGPMGVVAYGAVRAQFITVLFMAILLWMIEYDRRGGRLGWILAWPILFVAWVNLHGGFLVGLGVVGVYAIESTVRSRKLQLRLYAWMLVSLLLTGVSPYGYRQLVSVIDGAIMPRPLVPEWFPLWNDVYRFGGFLFSLFPLVYCVKKLSWKSMKGLALVVVCGVLAVRHLRHSSLYAVAWFCYVPGWLSATPAGIALTTFWYRRARMLVPVSLVFIVLLLGSSIVRGNLRVNMPTTTATVTAANLVYPVGPVAYLAQQDFHGNVMTPFETGAFVSWKLAPAVKVSIDSRYEVAYPPAAAQEMYSFYHAAPGWRDTLSKYPTDLVLALNTAKVAPLLSSEARWRRVYVDDVYSLFTRPGVTLPVSDRTGQALLPSFP